MSDEIFLIVDDNDDLRAELADYLNRYGIKTFAAANAEQAKQILLQETVSIGILDIIMPGETGLQLMKWIKDNYQIPIILLTSLEDITDRVTGLELGADDYIPKPFDQRELLARSRAVLRRYAQTAIANGGLPKNAFILDSRLAKLQMPNGKVETLREAERKLLEVLIENEGEAVSRETLFDQVYQRPWNPEDRGIDNLVAKLRKQIELNPSSPEVIRTARHKGYMVASGLFKRSDKVENANSGAMSS